jgi:hypothetical protein
MVALVVVVTFVVLLLSVLVAGLLRSHADIIRSLHDLGVGVGDPAAPGDGADSGGTPHLPEWSAGLDAPTYTAHTVAGVTPAGDARAVAVDNTDGFVLLAFLSSGCTTCASFWKTLQEPDGLALPDNTRVVIVTKGPDREVPSEVASMSSGLVPVVMSTEAWVDYQVPGSPFFVLVDGRTGLAVGQGVAAHVSQLLDLIHRAEHDRSPSHRTRRGASNRTGPEREADADDVLRSAGIHPGDSSLYPQTLEDVFPFSAGSSMPSARTQGAPSASAE